MLPLHRRHRTSYPPLNTLPAVPNHVTSKKTDRFRTRDNHFSPSPPSLSHSMSWRFDSIEKGAQWGRGGGGEAKGGGGVGVGGHLCIGSSGFLSSRPAGRLGTEPTRPSPAAGLKLKLMDPLPSLLSSLLGTPPSLWPVCLSSSKWQGRTVIHSVTPPSIHRDIHRSEEHRTCMSLLHAHIATLWQKWVNPAADSPLLQQNARFSRHGRVLHAILQILQSSHMMELAPPPKTILFLDRTSG